MPGITLASAVLFATALAGGQAAHQTTGRTPATVQPGSILPGTYNLEIAFGGGTIDGTLVIAMIGDSTDAKLSLGDHSPPISSITRKGSTLLLSGKGDGVDVVYELQFTGETMTGKFVFNGDAGSLTGKRRK
jgi:hypothetical protein